ncbi:hypothetical protein BB734_05170 [Mycobacterium avium subsp. hominissuis]|uniref:Uncharacterized protein n=1 Tax=Mycobacterium avium TaxID=1764 RepID=A0A2A2ZJH0_MYCAV|nr:hypothetical protein CKJ66_12220 [Mycobacterium avium]PBD10829.1 hypothetical protein BI295_23100 [Mycobacterium avium subsp. hominissuis]SIN05188.1 Uncharacterised protein [Mycobacteroides abscessus subsp. abscessus]PBA47710.1 hypothetical protein CKJ62_03480 [Mycobacterium avium]PBA48555.1 hypothetical protein CKJ59_24365 [Mycobacterium avium]
MAFRPSQGFFQLFASLLTWPAATLFELDQSARVHDLRASERALRDTEFVATLRNLGANVNQAGVKPAEVHLDADVRVPKNDS